jgi:hypothetical protein
MVVFALLLRFFFYYLTQNKIFCLIAEAFFSVSNQTLRRDLKMNTVLEATIKSYARYHNSSFFLSFFDHPNILAENLSNPMPSKLPK